MGMTYPSNKTFVGKYHVSFHLYAMHIAVIQSF